MSGKGRRSIQNAKLFCGQCEMEVKENEDNIDCDKCAKCYHALCTSLNKRQFEHLLKNESEEYVCNACKECDGTVKEELVEIKKQLKQLKKLDQLSSLQETMTFMSKQFDEIIRGVAENKKKIEAVQKENRVLKNEVNNLKDSVKLLNDERVKNNCLISGIEVKEGSTAVDTLLEIAKDVGVDLKEDDVEEAFFIKKNNTSNKTKNLKQSIIVKFDSKKSKQKLMSAKQKLKEKEETKSVYVNDCLSKETFNLFRHAKTLHKVGYQSVYTYSGRVYVKLSEISKPRLIRSEEEVDDMLLKATTNKLQKRRSNLQPPLAVDDTHDEDETRAAFMSPA